MKFAAIVVGATLLGTIGASAQGVELRVNPGPDRVYVDRDRDVYRDRIVGTGATAGPPIASASAASA